jgi:polar amino acid transport system permease protein
MTGSLLVSLFYLSLPELTCQKFSGPGSSQFPGAIGLSTNLTYTRVVIPQVIRRVLPASAGQFANLIKDSSLLYLISVPEFFMQTREVNAKSYATFETCFPLVIGYLALTLPISLLSRHLERKYGFDQ